VRYRKLITTATTVVALMALGVAPALANAGSSGLVPTPTPPQATFRYEVPETLAMLTAETPARQALARRGVPIPGNMYWDGYAVTTASGKQIDKTGANLTIPNVDCKDSMIGTTSTNGASFLTGWVGIDGYGTSDLSQTGFFAYCTGTPGHKATGGPFYYAWYYICCAASSKLVPYPGQPAIHPGDSLGFEVTWNTSTRKFDFTFADHATNQTFNAAEACPSGENCSLLKTAEVITESPGGGPPGDPLPYWQYADCLSCSPPVSGLQYSGAFVHGLDGTRGTLDTFGGEWTSSGKLFMKFPSEAPPYAIGGWLDNGGNIDQGYPGDLTSAGSTFLTGCVQVLDNNPQDDLFCPS